MKLNQKKKKVLIGSIIALALIIIVSFIIFHNQELSTNTLASSVPSGSYIQVPTFMWYSCEPAPENYPATFEYKDIPIDGLQISCPKNAKTCDIAVIGEANTFLRRRVYYQLYDKTTNVWYQEQYKEITGKILFWKDPTKPYVELWKNLGVNQLLKIRYTKDVTGTGLYYTNTEGSQVEAKGTPYILWKNSIFSGGKTPYTSVTQGCTIPTSDKNNLLQGFQNLVGWSKNTQTTTSTTLAFGDTRNFIDNFVPIATENVKFVDNGNSYCMNNRVYPVASVTTNSGTYKVVDVSGAYVSGRSVTCCPGDVNAAGTQKCDANFNWVDLGGAQCSAFNPCAGVDPYPYGSKQLQYYTCDSGYCKQHVQNVECSSDYDCIGSPKGNYCDRTTWKCTLVPVPVCPTTCSTDAQCSPCGNYKCENNACVIDTIPGTTECPPLLGFIPDIFCMIQKSAEKTWLIIKFISIAILTLMTLSFANTQVGRLRIFRNIKNRRLIIFLISLGISLGIAYLLYVFIGSAVFWFILVSIIALIVVTAIFFPEGIALARTINSYRRKK